MTSRSGERLRVVVGCVKRNGSGRNGERSNMPRWPNGSRPRVMARGYVIVKDIHHPRADSNGYVYQHIIVAEGALGRPLKAPNCIHHVNENKSDNRPRNLVICEDQAYHSLLHVRQRVIERGGDPNTQKICAACGELLPKTQFYSNRATFDGLGSRCRGCAYQVGA